MKLLGTKDVAELLGVSRRRINQFVHEGRLRVHQYTGTGQAIFAERDVQEFARVPRLSGRPAPRTS